VPGRGKKVTDDQETRKTMNAIHDCVSQKDMTLRTERIRSTALSHVH